MTPTRAAVTNLCPVAGTAARGGIAYSGLRPDFTTRSRDEPGGGGRALCRRYRGGRLRAGVVPGRRVARIHRGRRPQDDVFVVRADGSDLTRVTHSPVRRIGAGLVAGRAQLGYTAQQTRRTTGPRSRSWGGTAGSDGWSSAARTMAWSRCRTGRPTGRRCSSPATTAPRAAIPPCGPCLRTGPGRGCSAPRLGTSALRRATRRTVTQIAFQADLDGGCIYRSDPLPRHLTKVTTACDHAGSLSWSPDGLRLVLAGGSHGPEQALVVAVAGSTPQPLIVDPDGVRRRLGVDEPHDAEQHARRTSRDHDPMRCRDTRDFAPTGRGARAGCRARGHRRALHHRRPRSRPADNIGQCGAVTRRVEPVGAVLAEFDVGGDGWAMAATRDHLWIQVDEPVDSIVRVDKRSGQATPMVPQGHRPEVGPSGLWVLGGDWLVLVDPGTGKQSRRVPLGGTFTLAEGSGWLLADDGTVYRVDVGTGQTHRVARVDLALCAGRKDIAKAFGFIWLACKQGQVVKVPLDGGKPTVIPTGSGAHTFAVTNDALWVTNYEVGTISRIDPVTGETTTIEGVGSGVGITAGGGYVWSGDSMGIAKIDPQTGNIVGHLAVPPDSYYELIWDDGVIWASTQGRSVLKISTNT